MIDAPPLQAGLPAPPGVPATHDALFHAVRLLAPLVRQLEGRPQLMLRDAAGAAAPGPGGNTARVIAQCFRAAGADRIEIAGHAAAASALEQLLSRRVCAALSHRYDHWADDAEAQQALTALQRFDFSPPPRGGTHRLLDRPGGVRLSTYTALDAGKPPLLMILPCGMPFGLCSPWFDLLRRDHSVLTWETRGLFGEVADFDTAGMDLDSQLDDLFALLDHLRIARAHVMGLCGGAVFALRAARRQPERFHSMSLWYGDYHVADHRLRTPHQKNFDWVMSEAAQGRAQARELHKLFIDPTILATVPDRIAHWVLHPYANPELLYRYARAHACLNDEDVTDSLAALTLPALVVAGDSDSTTHSGASAFVAAGLPQARFELERHGNHQAFFSAPPMSCELALRFLAEQAVP